MSLHALVLGSLLLTAPAATPPVERDVTVFAAASLTDAFTAAGEAFEQEYPDADVTFNFAASSDLVTQIAEGAPADVFASADQRTIDEVVEADLAAGEPATFATNSLMIIVEPRNPLGIESVADLADPDLIVVTCAPEVPIGGYTQEVFAAAGVEVTPDSFEENVRGIVGKVVAGEADAGVVYATDVTAAGDDADGVPIPDEINVVAEYPIAALADAPNPDGAAAFVEFVLSDRGQAILAEFGFGPPSGVEPVASTAPAAPPRTG
jgi:molybdate transport system substrate-binding protein